MTLNLISIGAIVPQQLSTTGIVGQISTIFNIPTEESASAPPIA